MFIKALLFFLALINISYSQNGYLKTVLTKEDGLPSNQTTSIIQDKLGYIWIGTMNGAVRYDGKNMKIFKVDDGLTSNEVQGFFEDPVGRIWFHCFGGKSCYYLDGKIYNQFNDPRLKWITTNTIFTRMSITKDYLTNYNNHNENGVNTIGYRLDFRSLRLGNYSNLGEEIMNPKFGESRINSNYFFGFDITKVEGVTNQDLNEKHEYTFCIDSFLYSKSRNGTYLIYNLYTKSLIYRINSTSNLVVSGTFKKGNYVLYDDNRIVVCTNNIFDTIKLNERINSIFIDALSNLWITTNNGIILLKKKNISYPARSIKSPVYHISKIENDIFLGLANNQLENVRTGKLFDLKLNSNTLGAGRTLEILKLGNKIIGAGDYGIYDFDQNCLVSTDFRMHIKNAIRISNDKFLCATHLGLYEFVKYGASLKTSLLYPGRIFNVFLSKDSTLYIATENGIMYRHISSKDFKKRSIACLIGSKINHFNEDSDGNLIVSSTKGIAVITKRDDVFVMNKTNGIADNQINKTMSNDAKNRFYICTNNGLNILTYQIRGKKIFPYIKTYTVSDGLPSNEVMTAYESSGSIYVGTSEGLAVIPLDDSVSRYQIPIALESVKINDSQYLKLIPNMKHFENTIQFHFSAFYYQRTDELVFSYQLTPLHSKPIISDKSEISFQGLQPDDYTLRVYAYDKHYPHIRSKMVTYKFAIMPPFYQTWWFYSLAILCLGGIIYLYYRRELSRLREVSNLEMKMSQLKLEALKAEMNPHFVFNCLSAIKDYVMQADIEKSQYYLNKLAKLIRLALYNSKDEFISLEEEIQFIDTYLELERMRFDNKFDFIKELDIEKYGHIQIPTMILQPFFENAIRHGKIGQLDKQGKLFFHVSIEEDCLVFDIKDNGIGYEEAMKQKRLAEDSHRSMAMDIIQERISIYNRSYQLEMKYEIHNLESQEYKTQIIVYIHLRNL
jgi:ligand-binding sensor domain-containing protein